MEDQNVDKKSNTSANTSIKGEKKFKKNKLNTKILNYLSDISSRLKKITDRDEKVQILVKFDEYLKKYGDIIEKECPDKLVSILNSL